MRTFSFPLAMIALFFAVASPLWAQEGSAVRLYVFGNSLVNHLSERPKAQTNVPVWLDRLARTEGRHLRIDGEWGFLRDFIRNLPPKAIWSFSRLAGAWSPERMAFGRAGFDAVMIAPANFIQYQPPGAPYADAGAGGVSPLSATLELIDWVEAQAPGTRILLYEGWADMAPVAADFPPGPRAFGDYLALNQADYHQWYLDWHAALVAARPGVEITLVPVAPVLARLLQDTALAGLAPEALFSDNAPHGTPTLYLLAAMISYQAVFATPLPAAFDAPDGIDSRLADAYPQVAGLITQAIRDFAPGADIIEDAAPAPRSAPETRDPRPVPGAARIARLAAQTDTGLAAPALAMGLNGIADWSTQHPFIDVMKTARTWVAHRADQWGAWDSEALAAGGHLGPDGWPVSLPEGATAIEALILTDQPEGAARLAGRYRVTWQGTGTLRLTGRASRVSIREAEHTAWFAYSPGDGAVGIAIRDTDPADPIRNIVVLREAHVPLWEAGALFNPDWLAVVRDLRAVRFMDWMMTNGSPVVGWDDRPRLSDYTYDWRGVPVEVMVALANEIGADPWFCMPHMADDAYVRAFATYVRDHLDPRLIAWEEYSNEMWNFLFPQAEWARAQALERWGDAAGSDGWMQFSGLRAAQVAGIWADTFGDDAPARLRRVVAVHTGWPGLEEPLLTAPLATASGDTPAPAKAFDAYAVSGYFGFELGGDEFAARARDWAASGEAGLNGAAAALRDGSLTELLDDLFPHHAAVATRLGLDLVMYEGGTHVVAHGAQAGDEALGEFFTRLNYSPQMAALYDVLLYGWRARGGTLFNAFVDVSAPSQYGSWGALRHLDDDNPRWRALAAYNAESGGDWEPRAPGAFLHGITLVGSDAGDVLMGTGEEDTLLGGPGDDLLVSNGGGDHLHGGAGNDIAVLPGTRADYVFTADGPRLAATSTYGDLTLFSLEALQFTDAPGETLAVEALR